MRRKRGTVVAVLFSTVLVACGLAADTGTTVSPTEQQNPGDGDLDPTEAGPLNPSSGTPPRGPLLWGMVRLLGSWGETPRTPIIGTACPTVFVADAIYRFGAIQAWTLPGGSTLYQLPVYTPDGRPVPGM